MTMTSNWTLPATARLLTKLTACFMLLLMTTTITIPPSDGLALRDGGNRPVVVVPPRAYFLCWKGVCDPRLWDDMVKRNPYYSFGLGKRSVPQLDDEQPTSDEADDNDNVALYKQQHQDAMEKKSRYNFGVGKKDDNQRFRFGLGKRAGSDDGGRRFQFGLGKRLTNGDEVDDDEEAVEADEEDVNDVNKRKSSYNFGLGKRDKMYSFGLGKRDKMYSFGLGKRSGGGGLAATERLEKREIGIRETSDDYKENEQQSNRQQMVESTDKRARFGFGLGKRHNDDDHDDGHPVQVISGTTVLPSSAGQPSKSL